MEIENYIHLNGDPYGCAPWKKIALSWLFSGAVTGVACANIFNIQSDNRISDLFPKTLAVAAITIVTSRLHAAVRYSDRILSTTTTNILGRDNLIEKQPPDYPDSPYVNQQVSAYSRHTGIYGATMLLTGAGGLAATFTMAGNAETGNQTLLVMLPLTLGLIGNGVEKLRNMHMLRSRKWSIIHRKSEGFPKSPHAEIN